MYFDIMKSQSLLGPDFEVRGVVLAKTSLYSDEVTVNNFAFLRKIHNFSAKNRTLFMLMVYC